MKAKEIQNHGLMTLGLLDNGLTKLVGNFLVGLLSFQISKILVEPGGPLRERLVKVQ